MKSLLLVLQLIGLLLLAGVERALGWPVITISLFHVWLWSRSAPTQVYVSLSWGWYLAMMYGINPGLMMLLFLGASWLFLISSRWWEQATTRFNVINSLTIIVIVVLTWQTASQLALVYSVVALVIVNLWLARTRRQRHVRWDVRDLLKMKK